MNRKALLLAVIACIPILSGCGELPSTSAADSHTKSTGMTAAATTKTTDSSTNTVGGMAVYKRVLNNEVDFFSTGENRYTTIDKAIFFGDWVDEKHPLTVKRFAVVDLDGDKLPEVVLELVPGSSVENNVYGYEVLHADNEVVYGYSIVYRGLNGLKTDGTFGYSNGAADNGIAKLRFDQKTYQMNILGYQKPSGDNQQSYFLNDKLVSQNEYNAFSEEQNKKSDVVWYNYAKDMIDAQVK